MKKVGRGKTGKERENIGKKGKEREKDEKRETEGNRVENKTARYLRILGLSQRLHILAF